MYYAIKNLKSMIIVNNKYNNEKKEKQTNRP